MQGCCGCLCPLESPCSCCRQAKDRFVRLKKERDYHRMNHRRVLQEKERLVGELRRLQEHVSQREDALVKMKTKYEVGRLPGCVLVGGICEGWGQWTTLAGYSAGKDAAGDWGKEEASAAWHLNKPGAFRQGHPLS